MNRNGLSKGCLRMASIVVLIMCFVLHSNAGVVDVSKYGVVPGSGKDALPGVKKALEACRTQNNAVLSFPKGRYDFYPNSSPIGLSIIGQRNLIIEGNGSEFVYHGTMKVALIDKCENITIRNLSVDWDRPFLSQGEIMKVKSGYIEVKFDKDKYPYVIEKGKLYFTGEGWKHTVNTYFTNLYDKNTRQFMYRTWDAPLGSIFEQRAVEKKKGVVRFYGSVPMKPEKGSLIIMRSMTDYLFGFDVENSKNVEFNGIRVYHCMSHAFFGKHSENITLDNAYAEARVDKGRLFSSACDAAHFMNCKGLIKVVNCAPTGNGDDFLNVHGRYFQILKKIDDHTVQVKTTDVDLQKGEEVWVNSQNTMQRGDVLTISSVSALKKVNDYTPMQVSFKQKLPNSVKVGDCLESKTWTASVEVRNCRMLKTNRGHGVLVTTPQKVVIENNYFNTVGAAIKMAGDQSFWFESGGNNDVTIRNNVFENCLTSGQASGNEGKWGNAVITIMPSFEPKTQNDEPFHKNIVIENNKFYLFDAPLLYARSVGYLTFTGNTVTKTQTFKPYAWQKTAFMLDGCKSVNIHHNTWDQQYTQRQVKMSHMRQAEVANKDTGFTLSQ